MLVRGSISGLHLYPRFLWSVVLGLGFYEADEGRLDLTMFPRLALSSSTFLLDYRHISPCTAQISLSYKLG